MPTRRLTHRVFYLTRPATAQGTADQLELLKLAVPSLRKRTSLSTGIATTALR